MATPAQLQSAIARAQAAGDAEAVADLQGRLQKAMQAAPVGGSPSPALQSAPEAPKTFQRAGGGGAGHAGLGDSVIKAGLGLKQLVGLGSKEDQAVLREMAMEEEADPEKGMRTFGNILGNVATTLLPGMGAAGATAKYLPKVAQAAGAFTKASPALGAMAVGGAQEAALAPVEGDTYGEQLLNKGKEGAKAAVLGGVLTKTLGKIAAPFAAKPDAEKLYAQGVNPTLQQAAAGAPGRFIGGLTAGVQNLRTHLNDQTGEALVKRATEGNVSVKEGVGEEFANAAKSYVRGEYDKVWDGKTVNLSPRHREAIVSRAGTMRSDGVGAKEAAEAAERMANRLGVEGGVANAATNHPMNPETARRIFRQPITEEAYKAGGEVQRRMLEGRDLYDKIVQNKSLSKKELARKLEVDKLNFEAKRLEEATAGSRLAKEDVDVKRIQEAWAGMLPQARSMGITTYDDLIAPAARILDATPNQNTARSAWAAARRALPIAAAGGMLGGLSGAGMAIAPLAVISLAGQTGPGAKALLGQYGKQKALAKLLREYGAEVGGAAGSAFTDGDPYAP